MTAKIVTTKRQPSQQIAFSFDEGGPTDSEVLGGKGAGLVELVQLGTAVPPGFTVVTAVARAYAQHGVVPKRLEFHLKEKVKRLEKATGKRFGDPGNALLLAVRSGAAVSMPGMMDTVLNLGMNDEIAADLATRTDARFAWDTYQRFLAMFGNVVLGIERQLFDSARAQLTSICGAEGEPLSAVALEDLSYSYRRLIEESTGKPMPDQAWQQLDLAVEAVLRSWNNPRAVEFRRIHRISNAIGTAVNVQAMVFGNRDQFSCSGVAFSIDVTTGDAGVWGEFLIESQGEDLVAGLRTPRPLTEMEQWNEPLYAELVDTLARLDRQRNHPVEVEFTVESGKLYCLQVRNAKMTAAAAATTAVNFYWQKRIDKAAAMALVSREQLQALKLPCFDKEALANAVTNRFVTRGLSASHGAATGIVVTSSAEAVVAAARGEKVVLVRPDTSPDDLPGMQAAVAIVTMTGGATSHAAVVARILGKPAVVGCSGVGLLKSEIISVDGASGVVVRGEVALSAASSKKEVNIFLKWALEEEVKLWRRPRLNLVYFWQQEPVERLLSDYYLTDAMAVASVGTSLEAEAASMRIGVHTDIAERLAVYLVMACAGEVRHLPSYNPGCNAEVEELLTKYQVERTGGFERERLEAHERMCHRLTGLSSPEQARFVELCQVVFNRGNWQGAMGGVKWGAIAGAAYGFLSGKLSHSLFADHTFDLQHNNGSVFGKNAMIGGQISRLHQRLEDKKHARCLAELYNVLVSQRTSLVKPRVSKSSEVVSDRVRKLYERGQNLALW